MMTSPEWVHVLAPLRLSQWMLLSVLFLYPFFALPAPGPACSSWPGGAGTPQQQSEFTNGP